MLYPIRVVKIRAITDNYCITIILINYWPHYDVPTIVTLGQCTTLSTWCYIGGVPTLKTVGQKPYVGHGGPVEASGQLYNNMQANRWFLQIYYCIISYLKYFTLLHLHNKTIVNRWKKWCKPTFQMWKPQGCGQGVDKQCLNDTIFCEKGDIWGNISHPIWNNVCWLYCAA